MRQTQRSALFIQVRQTLWWLFLIVLLLLSLYFFINRYFLVQKVTCSINDTLPCTDSLIVDTQEFIGKPMLFYNFQRRLDALLQPNLNFQTVKYFKILPLSLKLNFIFNPPAYQLITPNNLIMSFDQFGDFTIVPPLAEILLIHSQHAATNQALVHYQLDPVLHQKFMQLDYFTTNQRKNWQEINFIALNQLEITASKATYIIDLFNLDENLQKLEFLEKNWQSTDTLPKVDLRFRLPVIKGK